MLYDVYVWKKFKKIEDFNLNMGMLLHNIDFYTSAKIFFINDTWFLIEKLSVICR